MGNSLNLQMLCERRPSTVITIRGAHVSIWGRTWDATALPLCTSIVLAPIGRDAPCFDGVLP